MKYCEKCKNYLDPYEETYRGLCFPCYQKYLFEKIDHLKDKDFGFEPLPEPTFKDWLKKWFKKEK